MGQKFTPPPLVSNLIYIINWILLFNFRLVMNYEYEIHVPIRSRPMVTGHMFTWEYYAQFDEYMEALLCKLLNYIDFFFGKA